MVTYRNSSTVSFSRYISKATRATVLAFQFPEEDIERLRKLWQQPNAQPGNWLVKVGIGTHIIRIKLYDDAYFHKRFRLPVRRPAPIILETEESWNLKYSSLLSTETPEPSS